MQPQDPATSPVPQADVPQQPAGGAVTGAGAALGEAAAPEAPAKPKKPRNPRRRLWLAVAAGVLALLCMGGVGVAVLLYDEETKIDRAEPDAVVDNFLRAYLVNRDDERASLYQCKSGGDLQPLADYRADIVAREKQFSVAIRVSWATFVVQSNGANGEVSTDLVKTASDKSGRVSESWRFGVVDEDGWRVCSASKVG
ncbi:hypothetical protein Ade02nite_38460 [Paractinoplanes deccanensis]|uniref:Mce-associated membrane protein n=1 Tax=Paractinoplanes deccanensis TaxID=113561 RepID=A0ABQ3Y5F7_9ACTN|nr:hypothetical protein [Actinoplanes deccanensis]GID75205.1 hypothetical protein Ade02nite_38460 [Actinoplanes deccanensis]